MCALTNTHATIAFARFLYCLKALKEKRQRTVYRLTLVKSWNMSEVRGQHNVQVCLGLIVPLQIDEYVKLVGIGNPDFIEVKAVTYCGKSDGSSLTIQVLICWLFS